MLLLFFQLDNHEQPQELLSTESPCKDIGYGQVVVAMEVDKDDYANPPLALDQEVSPEQLSFIFNDYCGTLSSQIPKFVNKEVQTDICMKTYSDASTQVEFNYTNSSMQTTFIETKSVGLQVQRPDITFEDVSGRKSDLMFYTGIPCPGTFQVLFDEMDDVYDSTSTGQISNGRPRSLRKIDEFFMVLMRLRLGLLIEDIAQRFHISKSTCSEILNHWITYLSLKLSFLIPWPSGQDIAKRLPTKFKRYPRCRVIIDCTEIFTQTPQSLQYKTLLYSHYKSHMTYKSLIGIDPTGTITFVSDLWAGSISDKQLTKNCGILEMLESGDQIMANKGFLISDLTVEKGVELVIPPLKNKKFMRTEIEETRRIANLRIYVEMAIARVKNFKILQVVMPITMSQQASQIWKICAALTNLQPGLVKSD